MATAEKPTDEAGTSYGFFYGTLMAPEVFFTVCYRMSQPPEGIVEEHVFRDSVLPAYTRHRVTDEDYPGIIPDDAAGACVRGMLVSGLTETNIFRLDHFEGSEYERREVQVTLDKEAPGVGDGKTVAAQVYVFKDPAALERREWDFDEFRREKMHKWTRDNLTFESSSNDTATVAA